MNLCLLVLALVGTAVWSYRNQRNEEERNRYEQWFQEVRRLKVKIHMDLSTAGPTAKPLMLQINKIYDKVIVSDPSVMDIADEIVKLSVDVLKDD